MKQVHWKDYVPVAAICLGAIFALVIAVWVEKSLAVQPAGTAVTQNGRVIILDAGHGGIDGGTSAKDGTVEKDINLAITLKLRDMLELSGYPVVLTRDSDKSIHGEDATTIREKKVSDLKNRLGMIQSYPNGIFVSIHQNHYTESQYSGAQVFYSPNHPESENLAGRIQAAFQENLQPENTRQTKAAGKDLYLMWNAQIPAVLVECGFLSNGKEAELLGEEDYQQKVAFVLYCGILNYLQDGAGEPVTASQ